MPTEASKGIAEQFLLGIAGGSFVMLAKYGIDYAIAHATSPDLIIDYQDQMPAYRLTTKAFYVSEADEGDTTTFYKEMYVNVSVVNRRRQTAKNCRGFLIGIDLVENGRFLPTDFCDSIPLSWSYCSSDDSRKGIDIPKGVKQYLNVFRCCQEEIREGIQPCTAPETLRHALNRFKYPGEFRFRIQISADNVETKFFGLRVSWKENWKEVWASGCKNLKVVQDMSVLDTVRAY